MLERLIAWLFGRPLVLAVERAAPAPVKSRPRFDWDAHDAMLFEAGHTAFWLDPNRWNVPLFRGRHIPIWLRDRVADSHVLAWQARVAASKQSATIEPRNGVWHYGGITTKTRATRLEPRASAVVRRCSDKRCLTEGCYFADTPCHHSSGTPGAASSRLETKH